MALASPDGHRSARPQDGLHLQRPIRIPSSISHSGGGKFATTTYQYRNPGHPDEVTAIVGPNGQKTHFRYDAEGFQVHRDQPGRLHHDLHL